jgi:L-ascorbate metabolism protein UlaG (beta-lactamase superfamily)
MAAVVTTLVPSAARAQPDDVRRRPAPSLLWLGTQLVPSPGLVSGREGRSFELRWQVTTSATAWVFEYDGLTAYFGGDTAYDHAAFAATAARFPRVDVALLPIAPVEPASFARPTHVDGAEALRAFVDLGAAHMVPIHYDTFAHGTDPEGYAAEVLRRAMVREGIGEDRVHVLPVGGQWASEVGR